MTGDDLARPDRGRFAFDDRRVVFVLHGTLWCLTLPIVLGHYTALCDPDIEKYRNRPHVTIGGPSTINVLKCITHMTPEVGRRLTKADRIYILKFFVQSMDFINRFCHVRDRPYIKEAISDFQAAVNHLVQRPHHYGQSKWASLQMVEKFIKCYLRLNHVPIPRNHDLERLAEVAGDHGLRAIPKERLQDLECKADVRYGEVPVTGLEAVTAHHACLEVCAGILPQLKKPNQAL